MSEERGTIEVVLANGKSLVTTKGDEAEHFVNSNGSSIVPDKPRRKKKK